MTPAQHLRDVAAGAVSHLRDGVPVVLCCKGFEQGSGKLMTEVAAEALPRAAIAVLSGPTFAAEVARGLPTAVTLAAADAQLGRDLLQALGTPAFRPYLSADPIGAEVGGAVKNVLAIACGIAIGRKLGDNARAALLTRGLAEIMRLGLALGAQPATLMGLSGLGDLTLTCNGLQSRNLSLGHRARRRPEARRLSGRPAHGGGRLVQRRRRRRPRPPPENRNAHRRSRRRHRQPQRRYRPDHRRPAQPAVQG